jgi:hypothetical protein
MAVANKPRNIFFNSFIKGGIGSLTSGQVYKYSGFYSDLYLFLQDLD